MRFSLRALFGLIFFCALFTYVVVSIYRASRHDAVVISALNLKYDGFHIYEFDDGATELKLVAPANLDASDRLNLLSLSPFHKVEIQVDNERVSADSLLQFLEAVRPVHLTIDFRTLSARFIERMANVSPSLRSLEIVGCHLEPWVLYGLRNHSLQKLVVEQCESDGDIELVAGFADLEDCHIRLNLYTGDSSERGLPNLRVKLSQLNSLKSLVIETATNIEVCNLPSLDKLEINAYSNGVEPHKYVRVINCNMLQKLEIRARSGHDIALSHLPELQTADLAFADEVGEPATGVLDILREIQDYKHIRYLRMHRADFYGNAIHRLSSLRAIRTIILDTCGIEGIALEEVRKTNPSVRLTDCFEIPTDASGEEKTDGG